MYTEKWQKVAETKAAELCQEQADKWDADEHDHRTKDEEELSLNDQRADSLGMHSWNKRPYVGSKSTR